MKQTHIAAAALFAGILIAPAAGAQGNSKGHGSDKGKPPAAGAQGGQRGNDKHPTPPPQANRGDDHGTKADDHGANGGKPGHPVGQAIAGGVRGVEMRSPVANAVAKGPKNAAGNRAANAWIATDYLQPRDVKRYKRDLTIAQVRPDNRRYVESRRPAEYVTGGALAYAVARGVAPGTVLLVPKGDVVWLRNRSGQNLLFLNDEQARSLGSWRVSPLADRQAAGSPSFCRSGAGHPVWGRQWCLDKGFGLGTEGNLRWGRTADLSDLNFNGDLSALSLASGALLNLLGENTYNRLALHALTLGLTDPLTGTMRSDPASGQRLLLVSSGPRQIAEMVDLNNDRRPDQMLVALRPW